MAEKEKIRIKRVHGSWVRIYEERKERVGGACIHFDHTIIEERLAGLFSNCGQVS